METIFANAKNFKWGKTSLEQVLNNHQGVIILFFPQVYTVGCSIQAKSFRNTYYKFKELGWEILAVSVDTKSSLLFFKEEYSLPFKVISDANGQISKSYNALGLGPSTLPYFPKARRVAYVINHQGDIIRYDDEIEPGYYADQLLNWLKQRSQYFTDGQNSKPLSLDQN